MNNKVYSKEQQITDLNSRIKVLKETYNSNRIAYNTKVFQVDTQNEIMPKSTKIIEKGLGLKLVLIELVNDYIRLTFDIVK